jgi:hypothetical protein
MELTQTVKKVASMLGATEVKDRTIFLDDYSIVIRPDYRDNSKLTLYLSGGNFLRTSSYDSIGCSLSKGPALIVKDIKKRLLTPDNLLRIKKDLLQYHDRQKEKEAIDKTINDIEREGIKITRIKDGEYSCDYPPSLLSNNEMTRNYWQNISIKTNYRKTFDLSLFGLETRHLVNILKFINEIEG